MGGRAGDQGLGGSGAARESRGPSLRTDRLALVRWEPRHRIPLAALHADPEVMSTLGGPMTAESSERFAREQERSFEDLGYGLWAVERADTGAFVGAVGLGRVRFEASIAPAVEVSWRLAREAWGHGFATEAARASISFGFDVVGLDEIVAFTSVPNRRSRAVMDRLGMARTGEFEHPNVEEGDPLRTHILYRLTRI